MQAPTLLRQRLPWPERWDVQLAGNAYYFGKLYEKPTIGDPIRPVEPEDIKRANRLMYAASILGVVVFGLLSAGIRFGLLR